MNDPKIICAVLGLVVGVVGVAVGPLAAFIVLLFTLAGWVVGRYIAGEFQIVDAFLERFFSGRLRGGPEE